MERDHVTARSNLGPTFQKQKLSVLLQERLVDHMEVDCNDVFGDMPDLQEILPEPEEDSDDEEDANDPEYEADDIQNIYADGLDIDWDPQGTSSAQKPAQSATNSTVWPGPQLRPDELLKGYEYMPFVPTDTPRQFTGHIHTSPTIKEALVALTDLKPLLRPKQQTGAGYQDPDLDLWTRAWIEGMLSMLLMYTDSKSRTYDNWGASSCQTAIGMGRGLHCARHLRELCRAFIEDRKILPVNPYGDWNESMLADENLRNEISIYLLSIGNEISAKKLMEFLCQSDIKEKYGIEKSISHKAACRYLNSLGY